MAAAISALAAAVCDKLDTISKLAGGTDRLNYLLGLVPQGADIKQLLPALTEINSDGFLQRAREEADQRSFVDTFLRGAMLRLELGITALAQPTFTAGPATGTSTGRISIGLSTAATALLPQPAEPSAGAVAREPAENPAQCTDPGDDIDPTQQADYIMTKMRRGGLNFANLGVVVKSAQDFSPSKISAACREMKPPPKPKQEPTNKRKTTRHKVVDRVRTVRLPGRAQCVQAFHTYSDGCVTVTGLTESLPAANLHVLHAGKVENIHCRAPARHGARGLRGLFSRRRALADRQHAPD